VRPRQEVNSTGQLNIAQSATNHESMVSGSDDYIDVNPRVEPLYEELDDRPAQEVEISYDVPPMPYVYMGCTTTSANLVQQPPDVLPPPYVNMDCITTANPLRPPHYENAKH
jgi:hypothetical protein